MNSLTLSSFFPCHVPWHSVLPRSSQRFYLPTSLASKDYVHRSDQVDSNPFAILPEKDKTSFVRQFEHTPLLQVPCGQTAELNWSILSMLRSRWGLVTLSLIALLNLSYAANGWLVVGAVAAAGTNPLAAAYIAGYLLTLYLPNILTPAITHCSHLWATEMVGLFRFDIIEANLNRPLLWNAQKRDAHIANIFAIGTMSSIYNAIAIVTKAAGLAVTIASSASVLILNFSPTIGINLAISAGIAIVFFFVEKAFLRAVQIDIPALNNRVSKKGQDMTDNVMLGNPHNFSVWAKSYNQVLNEAYNNVKYSVLLKNIFLASKVGLSAVPSFVSLYCFTSLHLTSNIAQQSLRSFIGSFPLMLQLSTAILNLVDCYFQWTTQDAQFKNLSSRLSGHNEAALLRNFALSIQAEKLTLRHNGKPQDLSILSDPEKMLQNKGRYTLQGENASGKSTLLLLLKNYFKQRAYLQPPMHQLNFEHQQGSSGQSSVRHLEEIKALKPQPEVLLLDEWNANMDDNHYQQWHQKIDSWAEGCLVVEVMHT